MAQMESAADHIMDIITQSNSCTLEKVIFECPELTWDRVFIEINRLRREGQIRLTLKQPGYYVVTRVAQPDATQRAIERKVA
jgi:hypothetical protein